jgi:hypothetical protein
MSNYQSQDGNGALFKNDKGDNPARPDYRGDVTVGGVTYELSAWIKPMKNDPAKRFMSLSAQTKQAQRGQAQAPQQRQTAPLKPSPRNDAFDSDVPF